MKDLKRFKGAFTGYTGFLKTTMAAFKLPEWAKPTGKPPVSMFDDVAKNIKTIEDLVKDRFTYDEKSSRWKDLDTKNKGYTKLGNVEKYVDDLLKNLAKVEDALPNNAANLAANAELTAGIGKEGYISKAMQALKNNKWLNTFLKVLRPIAVILSVFDGVENAQAEMEDREGKMDKWIGGGLGGFLSGAVSSFFGEMLDFIKAIPGYIIKQFVPAGWLNEDGTFKEDENLFTSFMGKWENFSFTQVIKDIIQYPFDLLGKSFDFVRNLFGATGTTEEGQAEAQKAWDDWWSQSPLNMGKSVMRTLFNIVFSPINAVINELKRVFNIEDDGEKNTFMQNIQEFVEWLYGLIPSVDDIKRNLAATLPESVARGIGLGDYLAVDDTAYLEKMGAIRERAEEVSRKILAASEVVQASKDDPSRFSGNEAYALMGAKRFLAAQEERTQYILDQMATINESAAQSGISQQTINNTSQQIETFLFPNGGTGDGNDPLRVELPSM